MRRLFLAVLCFMVAVCVLAVTGRDAGPMPFDLAYTVFPTDEGADIVVRVAGGSTSEAWIGFGVGPGVPTSRVDRVQSLEAHTLDGSTLEVTPYAAGGFHVRGLEGSAWTASYSLNLRVRADDDVFYRASVRDDDYLVLVGSDAFARFGSDATLVLPSPASRPSGSLAGASVTFHVPDDGRSWRVVTTATAVTPTSFELREHPVGSVFAVGPIDTSIPRGTTGLRVARHRDWRVLPDTVETMIATLREALAERIGVAAGSAPAVALLLPLPRELRAPMGLRTSGMVRGDTVLLYADASSVRPESVDGIRSAMAVFLGHELFHLYVPTTLTVDRELSWLSEGWAMHIGRMAAVDAGWIDATNAEKNVEKTYRSYLDLGGYRAGSLPEASMGSESQRDLLYLRGELVFRLLDREWRQRGRPEAFERELWLRLMKAYDGSQPLNSAQVNAVLTDMFDAAVVRRYVAGQAPLTQSALGIDR